MSITPICETFHHHRATWGLEICPRAKNEPLHRQTATQNTPQTTCIVFRASVKLRKEIVKVESAIKSPHHPIRLTPKTITLSLYSSSRQVLLRRAFSVINAFSLK